MSTMLIFVVVVLFCVAVVVRVARSRRRPIRNSRWVAFALRFVFYGMFLAGVSLLSLGHSYYIRAKTSKMEARPDEQRLTNCADFCDACGLCCIGLWFKREAEGIVDCPEEAYRRLTIANLKLNKVKAYVTGEHERLDAPGGPHGH